MIEVPPIVIPQLDRFHNCGGTDDRSTCTHELRLNYWKPYNFFDIFDEYVIVNKINYIYRSYAVTEYNSYIKVTETRLRVTYAFSPEVATIIKLKFDTI